jgi:hypothetical protein
MNEPMENSADLLELLGAAWDGRLDEASFARLESLLAGDQGACDVLVAFSRMQIELAWQAATSQAHEKALSMLAPYFAEPVTAAATTDKLQSQEVAGARATLIAKRTKSSTRRYLAIAAGVLVPLAAIAWYSLSGNSQVDQVAKRVQLLRAPHRVARVVRFDDAAWQGGAHYALGELLTIGERLHLLKGTAQISMSSGADILLQSPCIVELTSDRRIRLERGKLTAQAATWAKGFAVETDVLQITDLGTRFAVWAESPGRTEAQVFEGAVRAEPLSRPSGAKADAEIITAGQAVKWNQVEGRVQRTQFDGSRFLDLLPEFRPLYPIRIANTGEGSSVGSRDSRWRITAGHASGGSFPVQALVTRPHSDYLEETPAQAGAAGGESRWISVLGGTSRGVASHAAFTFETSFDLTSVNPATVHLVGQILVDNRVQEIRLNGKPVDVQPWESVSSQDFRKFHVVEIREGFHRGVNRLEIDVVNSALPNGSYNPMALRVEWQAFGCAEGS